MTDQRIFECAKAGAIADTPIGITLTEHFAYDQERYAKLARAVILKWLEQPASEPMVKNCCNGDDSWGHCIADDDGRWLYAAMCAQAKKEIAE